jgi:predicted nucleotidyltransferase
MENENIKEKSMCSINTFNNYDLHFKFLPRFDNINKVVVFGSSVSDRCHSGSDIDLYLELKDNEKPPKLPYDKIISEVDMVINVKQTDSIWKAIVKDGIVVSG